MNEAILQPLIFILAFAGMVIIHEFGHFIVARLCGIEVEEFGIGLPTPGAITFWISKGFLLLKRGKRVEIPQNFRLPVAWNTLVDHDAKITVDSVKDRLVMRTIEFVKLVENKQIPNSPLKADHIYVDQNGVVVQPENAEQSVSQEIIRVGKKNGEVELADTVTKVYPGTRFTLNWLPLGGFVRPKGENDPNVEGGLAAASPWKRLAVLFAGPLMNLITAVIVYSFIVAQIGAYDVDKVLIDSVTPDSPAAQAGLQKGDIFISGNGQAIQGFEELSALVGSNRDKPIDFLVDRNGQQVALVATPRMDGQGRTLIGVGLSAPHLSTGSFVETLQWGATYTYKNIHALISLPARLIRGSLPAEQSRLVGLKGIYDIMGQSIEQGIQASETAPTSQPFYWYIPVLEIIATLSISLGVFNLFPFPALDGGRIIFVIPEILFHRRVPAQFENLVHGVGMTLLLLLMLYVNIMDFVNPITNSLP